MNSRSWVVFNAFMQKCHFDKGNALLHVLPKSVKSFLENLLPSWGDPAQGIEEEEILNHVHYSWLAPLIRMRTEDEIRLFLSALTEQQAKGLKKVLLFTNALYTLSKAGKKFLRKQLLELFLDKKKILPVECLPENPLNALLPFTSEQLFSLISFLGIRDLAVEMRMIIDKVRIKQILNTLSEHEQLYLKTLMQQKEAIIFKPLGLASNQWDGNALELKAVLKQRGINRLAKALYGKNESLIWYITHKLDSSFGKALLSFCTPVEDTKASQSLSEQVTDLIPYIQNLSTAKQ